MITPNDIKIDIRKIGRRTIISIVINNETLTHLGFRDRYECTLGVVSRALQPIKKAPRSKKAHKKVSRTLAYIIYKYEHDLPSSTSVYFNEGKFCTVQDVMDATGANYSTACSYARKFEKGLISYKQLMQPIKKDIDSKSSEYEKLDDKTPRTHNLCKIPKPTKYDILFSK